MKNSSLVYDIKRLLIYVVTLSITILIISKLFNFSVWLEVVVFISLQFILIYYGLKKISAQVELLPGIISLAREIGEGKFDGRVTNINESTELGVLAWTLNDVLDQLEAFTREMKTTVEYMSQGKFFRKLQSTGMHGQFLASMLSVENAILITENKTKAEQEYLMRNVQLLLQNMDRLANGDLTVRVEKEKDDVIGSLFNGFNSVVANMQAMIIQVTEAVHATASASSQISASSDEMALGAQEQTRQTAEVAVAVEQMTKTIIETSTNVTRASEAAKESGNIARDGGSVVNDTINGMNRIAEVVIQAADMVKELGTSSDKIGEIVQVIDDIADQTNLLALNAAIEAARAGEQGRGFAVVADEVRKLAERTTKATKEIAQMIKKIQTDTENAVYSMEKGSQEVNSGKQLAQRAESALNQIITSSSEVVDDISQVAAASEEQSSAAEQISKNIESISRVTQESASGIQQIATAAEDLNQLTNNLQEMVGRFVINNQNKSQSKRTNLLRK
ncbi:MAG: methyl-accepting chemotaxis protein [Ignavibacteria bacterium]|nr:methyl-accepting chemotaxis protein [Ignavibacteria bacterium]